VVNQPFESILLFWFGDLDALGRADAQHTRRWFTKDDAFDREIADRFGEAYRDIAERRREPWLEHPRGRLAYVIALDQFPRNMFRGTARMFEGDAQAQAAAIEGVARKHDRSLTFGERSFLYMPLMHSEDPALQDQSVALFAAMPADGPPELQEQLKGGLGYAERHRDIVARFGRFPHRNAVLGRESTPKESEFLQQPGSAF
jgi:uncharacterized protein (DUF924 family)